MSVFMFCYSPSKEYNISVNKAYLAHNPFPPRIYILISYGYCFSVTTLLEGHQSK